MEPRRAGRGSPSIVERCTVRISAEKLTFEAEATGFRMDVLEKVIHLLNLLNAFRSHPFLKGRLALKGGTALNLFIFDVPRLSVDIDLNYVGAGNREDMLAERPRVEQALLAAFSREGFSVRRMPEGHAGGKWLLRYESAAGGGGNLEVDLNFMFRIPLWPVIISNSQLVGSYRATDIQILDLHELAAGKLAALLSRCQARDMFDSHNLLHHGKIDQRQLRVAFIVYGAANRKDWRAVSVDDVRLDAGEMTRQLAPTLRTGSLQKLGTPVEYGSRLVEECRRTLSVVLPFTETEMEFLNLLLDKGEIVPSLLTTDIELQDRIIRQPLLKWKAINVKQRKNRS